MYAWTWTISNFARNNQLEHWQVRSMLEHGLVRKHKNHLEFADNFDRDQALAALAMLARLGHRSDTIDQVYHEYTGGMTNMFTQAK